MARYIDIEPLEKEGWYMARVYNDSLTSQTYEIKKLKEFPAEDVVERKRGEWISSRPDAPMFGYYYCSICGRRKTSPQDNYCPNCGADTRGEKYDA